MTICGIIDNSRYRKYAIWPRDGACHANRACGSFDSIPYLPTFESQQMEHEILRGSEATKPEGAKLPRGGGGCVPPPTVGSFCIFGLKIVQFGAYLERKFGLKV